MDYFSKVMPEFLQRESEFTFDFDLLDGWFWNMHLYQVKIKKLNIHKRSLLVVPGINGKPDSLAIDIEDADLEGTPIGGFSFGSFKMFNLTDVEFTGLKFRMSINIVQDENNTSYWQIGGASDLDFDDLRFKTDSSVINSAFSLFHGRVVKNLKNKEGGFSKQFKEAIGEYNLLLRGHSSFFLPWPDKKVHMFNTTFM